MAGDVDVLGQFNYLDVWNHERFLTSCSASRSPTTTPARCRSSGFESGAHVPVMTGRGRSQYPAARARRAVRRLHGRARRPRAGAARGRRHAAHRPRSRPATRSRCARETLAPWGDRVELVHADYRALDEVLDARGSRLRRRRARRSRRVVAAARRGRARVQLPARRAARHADGPQRGRHGRRPRRARRRARAGRRDLRVRRGAVLAAHRPRDRAGARATRPIDDDGPAGGDRAPRGAAARATRASIRPRARSRRCASGSTASSRGSTLRRGGRARRLRAWRRGWPSSRFTRSRIAS